MPGSRSFAAVGRLLSRGPKHEGAPDAEEDSVAITEPESNGEPSIADTPDVAETEGLTDVAEESLEDIDTDPQPARGESNKLGELVPKALEMVPPRHRWRSYLVAMIRLLFLTRKAPQLPVPIAAVVAAIWAVAVGLLICFLLAIIAQVEQPTTVAPWLWLVGHHIGFSTSTGVVTLLPIGLILVCLLPLRRAGRFLKRQSGSSIRLPVLLGLGTYVAGVIVITLGWGDGQFSVVAATIAALLCSALGGWWGWRRETGRGARSPILIGATWALAVPFLLGAVVIVVSLVASWDAVTSAQSAIATTTGEHVGLILLQLAYLPNLLIWAGAYVVGSGISIGNETISPFSDGAPALPDLPLLQILPTQSPDWTAMLPILVAIGAAAAAMRVQRLQPIHELSRRLVRALLLSGLVAVSWFLFVRLAGGSLGTEQLDYLGPNPGAAVLAGLVCLAGSITWALLPTIASDAKPVAIDLRERVARSKGPHDLDAASDHDVVDTHR